MDEPDKSKKGKSKPKQVLKSTKRGGVRSKNNRFKKQNKLIQFSIWGTHSAGLKAKKDSLLHNIKLFNSPSILTIQETKMRNCGNFRLKNYQVFEKIRQGLGGGILTAVYQNLEPVLIESANKKSEILVVQCQFRGMKTRIINGYGYG